MRSTIERFDYKVTLKVTFVGKLKIEPHINPVFLASSFFVKSNLFKISKMEGTSPGIGKSPTGHDSIQGVNKRHKGGFSGTVFADEECQGGQRNRLLGLKASKVF